MSFIGNALMRAIAALKSDDALSGVRIVREYTSDKKSEPLRESAVSVGVLSAKVGDGGATPSDAGHVLRCVTVLSVSVCVPHRFGGENCCEIACAVADALIGVPGTVQVELGKVTHDRVMGAFVMPVKVSCAGMLVNRRADSAPEITDIRLEGEINNANRH